MRRALIRLLFVIFLDAFFVALIDAPDIADDMHAERALWILAETSLGNADTLEVKLLYGKLGHFVFV